MGLLTEKEAEKFWEAAYTQEKEVLIAGAYLPGFTSEGAPVAPEAKPVATPVKPAPVDHEKFYRQFNECAERVVRRVFGVPAPVAAQLAAPAPEIAQLAAPRLNGTVELTEANARSLLTLPKVRESANEYMRRLRSAQLGMGSADPTIAKASALAAHETIKFARKFYNSVVHFSEKLQLDDTFEICAAVGKLDSLISNIEAEAATG